jgi:hypothetical protein
VFLNARLKNGLLDEECEKENEKKC